tara:strand:- start:295 stop:1227 length:933 start_codon:yes stop_codon:yes gene_type:complete
MAKDKIVDPAYTREILKKVRQIEIRTRKAVTDSLAGSYHSSFKGQGMDFEEVREYSPGDDVRSIDWNVTAKMNLPFIKKYREERELTITLMVDLSASGDFGSAMQTKRERAAEIASLLAFSAVRNNDNVGLLLFTDHVEHYLPPKKGRQHILRVIRDILFYEPSKKKTDIVQSLKFLNGILKKQAVVFLISDFLMDIPLAKDRKNNELIKILSLTRRRHDLVCISLMDPRELELPKMGVVNLEDAETGEVVCLNTSDTKVRTLYRELNHARRDNLKRMFTQSGIDHVEISTGMPYVQSLQAFFKLRSGKR